MCGIARYATIMPTFKLKCTSAVIQSSVDGVVVIICLFPSSGRLSNFIVFSPALYTASSPTSSVI